MPPPSRAVAERNHKSLRLDVAQRLRRQLLDGAQPGERLPSERKLAARFGVSVITLREALSALAEEGWLDRRHGSGTYVSLHPPRQSVGVLIELDISHPRTSYFYLRVLQQTCRFVRDHGYRARLYTGHVAPGQEPGAELTAVEFLEDVEAGRLDAVAVVATVCRPTWARRVRDCGVPIVGFGKQYDYRLEFDHAGMVRAGLERLISRGRRRIACLSWGGPAEDLIREILGARGLEVQPAWLRHDLHPSWPDAGAEEFISIWNSRTDKPDGLLVTDDLLFADIVPVIERLGIRVPEQLAIAAEVNRGNEPSLPFPATLIEIDPDEVAIGMGQMLVSLLEHKPIARPEVGVTYRLREAGPAGPDRARSPAEARQGNPR